MKNLKIFGDSIIKGVTYNGQSYHLCQEHDFDTLRAQGVTVENNAKMGATIDAGLKQLDRKLGACDGDTTVLFCFGDMIGWWPGLEDVLRATTTAITTGRPSRRIRTASICRTRRRRSSSTNTALPSARRRARGHAWP